MTRAEIIAYAQRQLAQLDGARAGRIEDTVRGVFAAPIVDDLVAAETADNVELIATAIRELIQERAQQKRRAAR